MTNRIIKFRAWDGKKMCENPTSPHMESFFLNDAIQTAFIGTELMQFTGLLDKNGKEIYEGDIVKWYTDSMWKFGKVYYGERGWEIDFFRAEPSMSDGGERQVVFEFQSFWPLSSKYDVKESQLEIIGNIYENPELLATK